MKPFQSLSQLCVVCVAVVLPSLTHAQTIIITNFAGCEYHTEYVRSDGSLWGLGDNYRGAVGDSNFGPISQPEKIVSSGVTQVSGGLEFTMFIRNGALWAMGQNDHGQFGDGSVYSTPWVSTPEQVNSGVIAVACGQYHTLFLKRRSGGTITELWAVGDNSYGQLGNGNTNGPTGVPVKIESYNTATGGTLVTAIAAGGNHSAFIASDGSAWTWGENTYGQLGNNTTNDSFVPVKVIQNGTVAIAAGFEDTYFIDSNGGLRGCGFNRNGELGQGNTNQSSFPGLIQTSGVTAVSVGFCSAVFVKDDGSLWAMGWNQYAQLGDGTTIDSHYPKQIISSNVVAVSSGQFYNLFQKSDGTLWGMGDDQAGQLGNSNFTFTLPLSQIPTTPPQINLTVAANQPVLSFPPFGTNFTLQTTADLTLNNWLPVTNAVSTSNGTVLQITNPAPAAFFRLQ